MPTTDPQKRRSYEKKYEQSPKAKATRKKYKATVEGVATRRKTYLKAYHKAKKETDYYVCGAGRLSSLRTSAKERGLEFSLTVEELRNWWQSSEDVCEYCRMTVDDFRKFRDYVRSYEGNDWDIVSFKSLVDNRTCVDQLTIDRIDSGSGYCLGNLAKCCWFCNLVKHRFLTAKHMAQIAPDIIAKLKSAIDRTEQKVTSDSAWSGRLGYFQQTFVKKGWGSERWLWNNDLYCGKYLWFEKDKCCSWHYHAIKDEVLLLDSGSIKVTYSEQDDIGLAKEVILKPGDAFHVPVGLRHRMFALEDSGIYEFSTHHEDSDSIRIQRGN